MRGHNRFSDWYKAVVSCCGWAVRSAANLDPAPLDPFDPEDVVDSYNLGGPDVADDDDSRREYREYILYLADGRWAWAFGGMQLEQMDDDRLPEWWPFGSSVVALDPDLLLAEMNGSVRRDPEYLLKVREWMEKVRAGVPASHG